MSGSLTVSSNTKVLCEILLYSIYSSLPWPCPLLKQRLQIQRLSARIALASVSDDHQTQQTLIPLSVETHQ